MPFQDRGSKISCGDLVGAVSGCHITVAAVALRYLTWYFSDRPADCQDTYARIDNKALGHRVAGVGCSRDSDLSGNACKCAGCFVVSIVCRCRPRRAVKGDSDRVEDWVECVRDNNGVRCGCRNGKIS